MLLVLSLYADASWTAFPSQATLAIDCGLSERTVRDELTSARELGWLARKAVGHARGWHYVYTLTAPTSADFRSEPESNRQEVPTGADFRSANSDRPTGKSTLFQPEQGAGEVEEQEDLKRKKHDAGASPWSCGVALLTSKGTGEAQARSYIGKLIGQYGEPAVSFVVGEARGQDLADPKAWLAGALKHHHARVPNGVRPNSGSSGILRLEKLKSGGHMEQTEVRDLLAEAERIQGTAR